MTKKPHQIDKGDEINIDGSWFIVMDVKSRSGFNWNLISAVGGSRSQVVRIDKVCFDTDTFECR